MKKIKIGVIPAAGKGNRIAELPLTKLLPKPMLPVANRPIIEYVIENMKRLGVNQIYIVIGHKGNAIRKYFGNGNDFGVDITYINNTKIEEGLAYSIGLSEKFVNEPFLVILGDDFTIAKSLNNLVDIFWKRNALAVEGVVIEKDINTLRRTCCIKMDVDGKIRDLIEKPQIPESNIRGCGVYVFDPSIFEFIKKTPKTPPKNEKEITNTLKLMAREGKVYGAPINGVNINVNTFEDLMKATALLFRLKRG